MTDGPIDGTLDTAVDELLEKVTSGTSAEVWELQYDLGLAWPQFTEGWGGRGLDPESSRAVLRKLAESGVPSSPASFVGLHQVSTLLHGFGDEELKTRHLRRIFTGEDQWCQLFSEPGAGSDLANVACSAVRVSGGWVVKGQKVWTSNAPHADHGLLLARTDPDAVKHRGMTLFILDMKTAGVEIRPLRQADGGARFSEVFLDQVAIPEGARLGEPGQGWGLSMQVLSTERGGASDIFLRPVDELLDLWRTQRGPRDNHAQVLRDEVVQRWIEARVIALNTQRLRSDPAGASAPYLAGTAKILASEHAQRLSLTLADVLGPEVLTSATYDEALAHDLDRTAAAVKDFASLPPSQFLIRARAMSIEGGTNEISRNIVGERLLGLEPDIRIDKGVPWIELAKS